MVTQARVAWSEIPVEALYPDFLTIERRQPDAVRIRLVM
jgi:hypothetical protein